MSQILGVDPSLHSSGWCWLRDGKVVEVGVLKISKSGERGLARLKGEVAALFSRLQQQGCPVPFDVLALESSHLTPKMRRDTGIILGQVAGIWLASIPFVELRFCTPGETAGRPGIIPIQAACFVEPAPIMREGAPTRPDSRAKTHAAAIPSARWQRGNRRGQQSRMDRLFNSEVSG